MLALLTTQGAPSDWDYEKWKAGGELGADFRLKEWWPVRRLRPPPPPPPDGWSTQLEVGDEVNIDFEGGWWDVRVLDKANHEHDDGTDVQPHESAVEYVLAGKVHIVPSADLRPNWCWYRGRWVQWHESKAAGSAHPAHGEHAWALPTPAFSSASALRPSPLATGPRPPPQQRPPPRPWRPVNERNGSKHAAPREAPMQLHQIAAMIADNGEGGEADEGGEEDDGCPCELPARLFPARVAAGVQGVPPALAFASRAIGSAFVRQWHQLVKPSAQTANPLDRSIGELLRVFPNGSMVRVRW